MAKLFNKSVLAIVLVATGSLVQAMEQKPVTVYKAINRAAKQRDRILLRLILERYPGIVNTRGRCGRTPLHVAAKKGLVEALQIFCEQREININQQNDWGWTPLYEAVESGYLEAVRFFCNLPDSKVNQCDKDGRTPLHAAASNDYKYIAQVLCWHPMINIDQLDNDGRTALSIAAAHNYREVMRLLILNGANLRYVYSHRRECEEIRTEIGKKASAALLTGFHQRAGQNCLFRHYIRANLIRKIMEYFAA